MRKLVPIAIGSILILAIIAALVFEPFKRTRLVIENEKGWPLARIDLPDGRFDHVFVHSIHQTLVEERFKIDEATGDLHLYELRYQSSGVGMPADAEGGYRLEDGHFVLSMDRTFRKIPLRVSTVPGHGIVVGGIYFPFRNWTRPMGPLVLRGERSTAFRSRR